MTYAGFDSSVAVAPSIQLDPEQNKADFYFKEHSTPYNLFDSTFGISPCTSRVWDSNEEVDLSGENLNRWGGLINAFSRELYHLKIK